MARTNRPWRARNDTGAHETGRSQPISLRFRKHAFGPLLPYPRRWGSRSPRMPHQRQEHDRFDDTVAD